MLVSSSQETNKIDWSDAIFVQLCSIIRDMSMDVRIEAFEAIGRIGIISKDILLQSLSKKVLAITKEKKLVSQFATGKYELLASTGAGAFVHGLEDEYYEVRKSACCSLRMLAILSAEFSGDMLKLLMGVLNDDSMIVQLQALETVFHLASCDCLKLQETHVHMFLGILINRSISIRFTVRKILKFVKLPDLKLFKLCINGLVGNLETYPQDEADIFLALFHIGQSHGNFVSRLIKEVLQEIEPAGEGKLNFDCARVEALLVLAISSPLSQEQRAFGIPPIINSYAVTIVGKISRALGMGQNIVLGYLSRCSISTKEFDEEALSLPVINEEQMELATSCTERQHELHEEVLKSMNLILEMVKDTWPLVQSGCTNEALRILRGCKEGLVIFSIGAPTSAGVLAFTLQYIQAMEVLIKVLAHFLTTRKFLSGLGDLELLFGKLERKLREMRCRFTGLCQEDDLHILELILVSYVLRIARVGICCHHAALKKLTSTVSLIDSVLEQGSIEPSNFLLEVKESLRNMTSVGVSFSPLSFKRLLGFFSFRKFMLRGTLDHIRAELDVPDNDSENPLFFIPGLPVSVRFKITLYNVTSKNRLWLRLTIGEKLTQFVFLEFGLYGGCDRFREFIYNAPFYRVPSAVSFTMRVCIAMECVYEDVNIARGYGGPKRQLVYLSEDKHVYFSREYRQS